jgi:hypothetical protein
MFPAKPAGSSEDFEGKVPSEMSPSHPVARGENATDLQRFATGDTLRDQGIRKTIASKMTSFFELRDGGTTIALPFLKLTRLEA